MLLQIKYENQKKKRRGISEKKKRSFEDSSKNKDGTKKNAKDLNPAEIQKFLFHEDQTPSRGLKNETKIVLNHKNSSDS